MNHSCDALEPGRFFWLRHASTGYSLWQRAEGAGAYLYLFTDGNPDQNQRLYAGLRSDLRPVHTELIPMDEDESARLQAMVAMLPQERWAEIIRECKPCLQS